MIEIIPAIIPKSFGDLKDKLSLVAGLVPLVQVDVLDGRLTPEKSWPFAKEVDTEFESIAEEQIDFPYLEDLNFEVDLMVKEPELYTEKWVHAGASRIILHYESFGSTEYALAVLNELSSKVPSPDSFLAVEIGLAINIDTPLEKIKDLVPCINFVQCMGIAHIGYQGEPFDSRVLEKIKQLREKYHDMIISVDGGVNFDSAPQLIEAGANRLVAGSAIYGSGDIGGAIEDLQNLSHDD